MPPLVGQLVRLPGSCYTKGVCGILAILFLVVPAIEIIVIIEVGAVLGTWATLAVIALTAIVGAALAKSQGLAVLRRLTDAVAGGGQGAGTVIVEGVLLLAAGITLLTPGFITDAIGLTLLVAPVRSAVARRLASHWKLATLATVAGGKVFNVEQEYLDEDDEPPTPGVIDV